MVLLELLGGRALSKKAFLKSTQDLHVFPPSWFRALLLIFVEEEERYFLTCFWYSRTAVSLKHKALDKPESLDLHYWIYCTTCFYLVGLGRALDSRFFFLGVPCDPLIGIFIGLREGKITFFFWKWVYSYSGFWYCCSILGGCCWINQELQGPLPKSSVGGLFLPEK